MNKTYHSQSDLVVFTLCLILDLILRNQVAFASLSTPQQLIRTDAEKIELFQSMCVLFNGTPRILRCDAVLLSGASARKKELANS